MRTRQPRITLRALARALNLSPTTVSRALNGYPEVGEDTRRRVEQAARDMGYVPDRSARRLAHGVADAFGLVFPAAAERLINPVFAEFIGGLMDFAATAKIEISLHAVSPDEELAAYRQAAAQRGVDGFIVTNPTLEDPRVAELSALDVPFVVHGRTQAKAPYAWLDIDNFGAFQRAGRLLADYGHRRIALIGGELRQTYARHRYDGLLAGVTTWGLDTNTVVVREGPVTEQIGYRFGCEAFDMPARERPTAFLCTSIFMALGVQRAGHERGLRAPEDFSLIAHDDRTSYLRSEYFYPPLTAVQSSIRRAGRRIAEMLQQRISGVPAEALQEELSSDLVLRSSVGRPPPESLS